MAIPLPPLHFFLEFWNSIQSSVNNTSPFKAMNYIGKFIFSKEISQIFLILWNVSFLRSLTPTWSHHEGPKWPWRQKPWNTHPLFTEVASSINHYLVILMQPFHQDDAGGGMKVVITACNRSILFRLVFDASLGEKLGTRLISIVSKPNWFLVRLFL